METTGTDLNQLLPDLDRLRARVRADQRATSAPMLAFGALIVGYAAIGGLYAGQLHAGGRHSTLLLYWPLATTVGLIALWWSARRRAGQDGVGEGRCTYQRNRLLGTWAAAIGVAGGAESVYVIANQGLSAAWWWLQPVVYTALGLALVAGGLVIGRRERAT